MLKVILWLCVFYVLYRFVSKWLFPKLSIRSTEKWKENFRKENPHIFNKEEEKDKE